MARYIDASCKLCRRERQKLFLKGTKCYTEKCPVDKRAYPPGQHGQNRRQRISEYGVQLREKQKVRRIYGLMEAQFRNYFERSLRHTGRTGDALVKLLERRLDNVVYRLGFAPSRKSARQLVLHRHFTVNNAIVDVPSYLLRPGDVIQVRDKSRKLEIIHGAMKRVKDSALSAWLSLDKANLSGTFLNIPERGEVPLNANEQLIVELYSK
ncbi:MAG: 30S ribosomal protein S4 [Ignavibacteria bacterium GWA2_55_11]|nr:MAG: 30S ribosomal protein S4 [Ignavibacteria bacterium GWA2_55_11]OGU43442.1 MAG: 30S ribosomal protein S4 [Ignavibacteria bacterium GWC2_56_12]OGU64974.1 MAG: 30S ribosomal protein S4 [Ignavibacteria bacterium RIFCSPHIGHO2_02_FULL_56_12]OGU71855.1 MAG: 30S ribosomal protein S4 [Ignavibacteria bacterium RIFCSPLOWO2_12_FULL_56_21]HAV24155.1 30S ribosomal protein S4 [Bacteroidota bacterium]